MYLLIPLSMCVCPYLKQNLHSIMYLLILGGDPQNGISKYHLHSIMYLLIHVKPNAVFKMFLAFTFHNVSINSHIY